ncbi:DUF3077 domain-containing protein [Pseudomonas sp. B329]|uniref:DUF6124 family protein n=1 Tax=Pseudomonas sp. B329 TaxID=1553459 RepID=UPI0020034A16|nr:DUF3077 domain-containing protein [Pseudomonas sp. B329]
MSKVVPDPPYPVFVAHEDLSFEDAIASISSLLRCATTTATETAEGLKGSQRDMACSTAHWIACNPNPPTSHNFCGRRLAPDSGRSAN